MERYVDMNDISDGRLYHADDMVRADALGCQGCSHCCHAMTETILLDPYDVYSLSLATSSDFSRLLQYALELNVSEGLILPNLKYDPEKNGCTFLSLDQRCMIHDFRPGFCRLFPLGRYYDGKGFSYFLQTKECPVPKKGKIKIRKWLGIASLERYEAYISTWHYLLKGITAEIKKRKEEDFQKQVSIFLLKLFYLTPFEETKDFFSQFAARVETFTEAYGIAPADGMND